VLKQLDLKEVLSPDEPRERARRVLSERLDSSEAITPVEADPGICEAETL
jgi:hypothetical protein